MAERQETSVMVSIQEILRDAQSREEQEKVEAEQRARQEEQRRLDDIRRRQEAEEARLRAEQAERERRAFEEQRRQAEILAMQEAAIQKARAEAEAQARLHEMAARQEHERQLHALSQDQGKKRLRLLLAGAGALLFVLAIGGGIAIKNVVDQKNVAEAHARQLEEDRTQAEDAKRKLEVALQAAVDPTERDSLLKQIKDKETQLQRLQSEQDRTQGGPAGAQAAQQRRPAINQGAQGGAKPPSKPGAKCDCTPGDPLCSCL
jgi:hypothetical protein